MNLVAVVRRLVKLAVLIQQELNIIRCVNCFEVAAVDVGSN